MMIRNMSTHSAEITWNRNGQAFTDNRYSRAHSWAFDGGLKVAASSSPSVVPLPMSDATAVDPEEAFVASLASCHMLWFLSLAAKQGLVVDSYVDSASGLMEKNIHGQLAITRVALAPRVRFGGANIPEAARHAALHHAAHEACFLARSVRTVIVVEPRLD